MAICLFSLPTHGKSHNAVQKSKNAPQEMWWLTLPCPTRKCHFFFSLHSNPKKSCSPLSENFKLLTRGLLIFLPQVYSRLTPICKDELKKWGRVGEWLFVNPHPSSCCWLFDTFCSLPPSLSYSIPLNYKPAANRNVRSFPHLLCNCPLHYPMRVIMFTLNGKERKKNQLVNILIHT